MRLRVSVQDRASGISADVGVDCAADETCARVLDAIASSLSVSGPPLVEGRPVDPTALVADSIIVDGAILVYGESAPRPPGGPRWLLRTVSGPCAGRMITLSTGTHAVVGRSPRSDLVLADPAVSRRHIEVLGGRDRLEIRELDPATNGTWVGAERVSGTAVLEHGDIVRLGGSRLVAEHTDRTAAGTRTEGTRRLLHRAPRADLLPWSPPVVEVPAPLPDEEPSPGQWLLVGAPFVMALGISAVTGHWIFMAFALLSPVLWLVNRRTDRQRIAKRKAVRDRQLAEVAFRLQAAADEEDAHLRRRWPDPHTVADIAVGTRMELWRRRPEDEDWLAVRLGVENRPMTVALARGDRDLAPPVLTAAPAGVLLGSVGVLGVSGPNHAVARSLDWIITQAAVLHGPDELVLAVVAPRHQELGWARWLPHLRWAGRVQAGWDPDGATSVLAALGRELAHREAAASRSFSARTRQLPEILVVITDAQQWANDPLATDVLRRGPAAGFRVVCVAGEERDLPRECAAVLLDNGTSAVLRTPDGAARTITPDRIEPGAAERAARAMAPFRPAGERAAVGGMPDSVRLSDLLATTDAGAVAARWEIDDARTLVPVGLDAAGPVLVDLVRHGPHALVAGTTGAGKSEFLQTWIGALAQANSPDRLNLLLMDYKGGPTFLHLSRLPHVVGVVTNLDQRLAERTLVSLRAELTHRQRCFAEAGVSGIGDYWSRWATRPELPPIARLVVVVDEFARMKVELPEVIASMIELSQVGRSLGIHIVLCTQRPQGVVKEDIKANTDLRICLRVAEDSASMDIIGVRDAIDIPQDRQGRGYVQRGSEPPQLFQSAHANALRGHAVVARTPLLVVPLHWHEVDLPETPKVKAATSESDDTDLNALINAVSGAARLRGTPPQREPVLPPLSEVIVADELPCPQRTLMLGLRDLPTAQKQEPLAIPLGTGHLGIMGSAGSGRTTALRSLAVGLARSSSPDEVHLQVIDGRGGLAALADLPHCGVVVEAEDTQRISRLLARLDSMVRDRKAELTARRAASVNELWAEEPDTAPPHVVLMVNASGDIGDLLGDVFQRLLKEGPRVGLTVCVAGDPSVFRTRLTQQLSHRLCLRLNDNGDGSLFDIPAKPGVQHLVPGRGIWAGDRTEVQVPVLVPDLTGRAQNAELARIAGELPAATRVPPLRVDPLPTRIDLGAALALPGRPPAGPHALLAVGGDTLGGLWIDLAAHPLVVIAGPRESGLSTAAATVMRGLIAQGNMPVLVTAGPTAASLGINVVGVGELDAAIDTAPDALVLDDADMMNLDDATVARLTSPGSPPLVVTVDIGGLSGFGGPPIIRKCRQATAFVLINPGRHRCTEIGLVLQPGTVPDLPGRAMVARAGRPQPGQVPYAEL